MLLPKLQLLTTVMTAHDDGNVTMKTVMTTKTMVMTMVTMKTSMKMMMRVMMHGVGRGSGRDAATADVDSADDGGEVEELCGCVCLTVVSSERW